MVYSAEAPPTSTSGGSETSPLEAAVAYLHLLVDRVGMLRVGAHAAHAQHPLVDLQVDLGRVDAGQFQFDDHHSAATVEVHIGVGSE